MKKTMTLREALHYAVHTNRIATDTGNRELRANTREFIKANWSHRNSGGNVTLIV